MSKPHYQPSRKLPDITVERETFLSDCADICLATRLLLAKNATLREEAEIIRRVPVGDPRKTPLIGDAGSPRIEYLKAPAQPRGRVIPFPLTKVG